MTLFDFITPISFSFSHRCTSLRWRLMECVLMHCFQNCSVLISNPKNINRTHMNKSSLNVSENIFFQSVKGPSDQRVWEPLNTQPQNLCGVTPGSFCLPQARATCSPLSWVSCGVELGEGESLLHFLPQAPRLKASQCSTRQEKGREHGESQTGCRSSAWKWHVSLLLTFHQPNQV